MRIVHDIDALAQVCGGPDKPYALRKNESGPSKGFRVGLVICWTDPLSKNEESIHIEGDAKYVLYALQQAMGVVEISGQALVKEGTLAPDWADVENGEKNE